MSEKSVAGETPPEPTTPPLSDARRDATEAVTWGVRVGAAWTWRILLIGFGIYVFVRVLGRIEVVSFSFVIALLLTSVLNPLDRLLRRVLPRPRSLASALSLLIGLAILVGIGWFVAWQISDHAEELGNQLSDLTTKTRNWLQTGPFHVKSKDLDQLTQKITKAIQDNQGKLISGAIQTVRTVADVLAALLLVLLSTFFLLRDGDQIWRWTVRLFPARAQETVDRAGHTGWHTLGGYMRGQVLIALFHGVSVTIVLFALRVPLAAALGVLIFLGSFIPLIGLTVTGAFAVGVALLEHGFTAAIVVAVAIVVLIQLEAHLLQPVIMSRSVEVHPLAIALSVIAGTTLAGIPGALLAVPLVAFVNAVVHAIRGTPDVPTGDSGFPVEQREDVTGPPVDGTEPPEDEQD